MLKKIAFCLSLSVNLPFCSNGQTEYADIYDSFDSTVGLENTVLFNGIESLDFQKVVEEKNMFWLTSSGFTEGNLVYDGQFFPKILLKFNVFDDRLLVRIPINKGYSSFQLITEKIENFTLKGHHFRNLKVAAGDTDLKGFYEEFLLIKKIEVFKKYRKREKKRLDKGYVFYEYYPDDPEYFLKYNGEYWSVNSKREIIEVFPEFKKEIRQIYRNQKDLRKNNIDAFMKLLFNKIVNHQN